MPIDPYFHWRRALQRAKKLPRSGILGTFLDGSLQVKVTGRPAYFYVSFEDNSYRKLLHRGRVNPISGVAVRLGYDIDGVYCILGLETEQDDSYQSIYGGNVLIPEHTNSITELQEVDIVTYNPGDILIADGTYYNSEPLGDHALLIDGSNAMTADLDLGGHAIINASGVSQRHELTFYIADILQVSAGVARIYNLFATNLTIIQVFCAVNTAPTGADVIVDVNQNGTTIFTTPANRPVIAAGAESGDTTTIDAPTWVAGNYLTVDVDQIGSAVAGADLTVHVIGET